jgi:hypothetical protein
MANLYYIVYIQTMFLKIKEKIDIPTPVIYCPPLGLYVSVKAFRII